MILWIQAWTLPFQRSPARNRFRLFCVADTVFLPVRVWEGCERRLPRYAGGFLEDARLPYHPFPQWTRSGAGTLAFGCPSSFTIDVVQPAGGVTRISREWAPPVMSDAEHDYYSAMQRMSAGPPRPRFTIPRERPAFLRIWAADSGQLWVWPGATGSSREVTEQERTFFRQNLAGSAAPTRIWNYWSPTDGFDVFGGAGRWIGHVDTPESWDADPFPGIIDPQFRGDTIWGVTEDELGVERISKFVVEWPESL